MIHVLPFVQDKNQRELTPQLTPATACVTQYTPSVRAQRIGWHWHEAIEVNYVAEGEGVYRSLEERYDLRKGDVVFVNSNALHMMKTTPHLDASIYTTKFHPEFLAGSAASALYTKYIRPILDCDRLHTVLVHPEDEQSIEMIRHYLRLVRMSAEEPPFYEVQVQMELWNFWMMLFERTAGFRSENANFAIPEHGNMKRMLEFISEHYPDRIQVREIAEAGAVSVRECTRCFQKFLHQPPNEYLNYYRLQAAAQRLVQEDVPITQISEDCGFSQVGYFGRIFKNEFGCTPGEFRRAHAAGL